MAISREIEDYGRRLLPNVVEHAANVKPNRIAYSFPITNDPAQGFHAITNRIYANGVNRTAWWIEENFGKPELNSFPSIGYIGPNDLRYAMLTIAAVKIGYKMMLLSPRNSIEGHLAVTDRCNCSLWILPSQRIGRVHELLAKRSMKVKSLPELLVLLDEVPVPTYPYEKTFSNARQDPFVVLHTSGSTGLPKPVVVPNGSLATVDAHHLLPAIEGRLTQAQYFTEPHRAYSTFPNFHSAGMVWCFAMPFFYELSIVLGPAMVPVNLDLVDSMFDHANVDGSCLAPSTLEDISKSKESLARMSKTLFTCFGGGPLSQECGDRINAVTRVFNTVGVTEGSLFPIVQAECEDWNYIHFHPAGGYTYHQKSEELWEQFQTRDEKLDLFQAFFQTFPHLNEYPIKDLYRKHPTKPNRWAYRGRTDDVIVLSNGEKLNPLDMEAAINEHPDVKASLVVGQGRFQTTAIIQLRDTSLLTDHDTQRLKDSIWCNIEAANAKAPAHAQVHKDYIMFAPDHMPFILAGKETVLRAMTVGLYENEINDFYAKRELQQTSEACSIDLSSPQSTYEGLNSLICAILGLRPLAKDDDFFAAGLDSLSVFKVLASIRKTVQAAMKDTNDSLNITAGFIYSNPTLEQLSNALYNAVHAGAGDGRNSAAKNAQMIASLVRKYAGTLPDRRWQKVSPRSAEGVTVLLTGSTGSLGSYLLSSLSSQKIVSRIFCLNRCVDGKLRQSQVNESRGLETNWCEERVRFLHTDLSKANFGLDSATYDKLLGTVTHIIHNQWQVDFNLALSSFEPHIRGVRNLIDFSLQSNRNASLFFISSIGVVNNQRTNDSVPEALIADLTVTEGGYGSSKLVSELLLAEAYSRSGVPGSICRVGQIAGPVEVHAGEWNKHEWLPSIIASSKYLNMIPSSLQSLDRVEWIPVNRLSEIILELSGLKDSRLAQRSHGASIPVFHAVNTSPCSWSSLLPAITSSLSQKIEMVTWSRWLSKLQDSQGLADVANNPAIKLLDFYEQVDSKGKAGLALPMLETAVTRTHSPTLSRLSPVNEDWMLAWMKQWRF